MSLPSPETGPEPGAKPAPRTRSTPEPDTEPAAEAETAPAPGTTAARQAEKPSHSGSAARSAGAETSGGEPDGLALHHIGVRFGGLVALDDVSLRVPPGRIVGVIGPNGAGKTTLFNAVCGFVTPTAGAITWDGRPLRPRPHRLTRLGIARTLQGVGQFAGLTVLENVMAGAEHTATAGFSSALFGLPKAARDEQRLRTEALAALEQCGVAQYADAAPGGLPFAVRKRVVLARALVARPRMLLLDEPAGGLGAEEIQRLGQLITELECAVLLVEHHMDLVMSICDEILVLDFGRPVAFGTPGEIRANPAVTRAYLGEAA